VIGQAHSCATPEPDKIRYTPPLPQVLEISSGSERSQITITFDPTLFLIEKGIQVIDYGTALMSFQPQQIIGNLSLSNNNNSFNNVLNFVTETDAEGNQILQWLSPLEPQQRHQAVRADRLHGVGAWALETNEFIKWRDAEGGGVEQVLFCYGNPGVGKTYVR